MIRFIIVAITVIGFLILSIPILLIVWIIGRFSPKTKEISSLRIIQAVFKFILWEAGTKITVIGEEKCSGYPGFSTLATTEAILISCLPTADSDLHRLYCQERNGTLSSSFPLDETSSLACSLTARISNRD